MFYFLQTRMGFNFKLFNLIIICQPNINFYFEQELNISLCIRMIILRLFNFLNCLRSLISPLNLSEQIDVFFYFS